MAFFAMFCSYALWSLTLLGLSLAVVPCAYSLFVFGCWLRINALERWSLNSFRLWCGTWTDMRRQAWAISRGNTLAAFTLVSAVCSTVYALRHECLLSGQFLFNSISGISIQIYAMMKDYYLLNLSALSSLSGVIPVIIETLHATLEYGVSCRGGGPSLRPRAAPGASGGPSLKPRAA